MSVIANYVRLSPADLLRWRKAPGLVDDISAGAVDGAEAMDVDKAWEALSWLVSPTKRSEKEGEGEETPHPDALSQAIEGRGPDKAKELSFGYGPACVLAPERVREASAGLNAVTVDQLKETYDPELMDEHGVYPEIWSEEGEAALTEYVLPHFESPRGFFKKAAAECQAVVVYFS